MSAPAPALDLVRQDREQHLLHDDTDVKKLVLDVVKKHIGGLDVSDSMIDGSVQRDITAASQVTITVHDQARAIVNHDGFYDAEGHLRTIDIHLDGLWFRLVAMEKQGDDVIITFEDRDIAILRTKKGPLKLGARRAGHVKKKRGVTRAEAILMLIRSVKSHKIPVRINELHKQQPIATMTEEEEHKSADARRTGKKRDVSRNSGFPAGFKMKGVSQQMQDNMTVSLDETERVLKGRGITGALAERIKLVVLVAGWGESGWLKSAAEQKFGTHKGVFQADQKYSGPGGPIPASQLRTQTHFFLVGGRSFRAGGAIDATRKQKTSTVGMLAQYVEVSDGSAAYYDSFFKQARKVLDAWGGITESSSSGKQRRKRYEFEVQNRETYWDAIQRMAGEVNWVAFFTAGTFYFISEEDLFKSRARYRFSEASEGISNIDFRQDERRTPKTGTVSARINRWAVPPGLCVHIDDLGPASGKWLVQSVERSLFSAEATLAIIQPLPEKVEPFLGFVTEQAGGGADLNDAIIKNGALADRLYQSAQQIGRHQYPYVWGGGHKKAGIPDNGTGRDKGKGYDCSGGVAACLFYANALPGALRPGIPRSDNFAEELTHYGWQRGQGESVTIWANASHIFLEVKPTGSGTTTHLHRSHTVVESGWIHLGTGRFGKSWGGFGVNKSMHPHGGFTPYSPSVTHLRRSHTVVEG